MLMNGVVLETVDEKKNLGMLCDQSLNPTKQCVAAVNTVRRTLGCIRRCFEYKSLECIKCLYTGLVRPDIYD